MNVDAVLVFQRSDVDHIAAHRERYADTRLLFIDPGVLDAAVSVGLQNYELRRLDVARDISALAYMQALNKATGIDLALTQERRRLWGDGAFHGWDQTLLYLTLQRAYTAQALGRAIERSFPEARLGLLRPANPALFHWDSMLDSEIVGADAGRWTVVDGYAAGRQWLPLLLDVCFDFAGIKALAGDGAAQCITHIPTCFYDAPGFNAAIAGSFERNIDLPGLYADVPVRRGGLLLRRIDARSAAAFDLDAPLYRERSYRIHAEHLADLIPSRAALAQQCEAFAQRSLQQAVNFVGLRQALAGRRPHFVISDHDIGSHGPLFSLAAELDSPITVLPHSSYPAATLPHARRVTAVERDGMQTPVRTVLGEPVATRAVRFRTVPSAPPPPRPALRQVCLLLNTMHSEGLSYVELFALVGLHRALAELCQRHGRELRVRLKPSAPALAVVAAALGRPAAYFTQTMALPLDELARQADLCIAFGEPTTAALNFLDAGSLMLHASEQDRPSDYLITLPLKDSMMRSMRCAEAVAEVEALCADPALYVARQTAQSQVYAARRAGAHDLIFGAATPSDPVPVPLAEIDVSPALSPNGQSAQEPATC